MAKGDVKKQVISKWAKGYKVPGTNDVIDRLGQVVWKTEIGKNRKGKPKFMSQTIHERV